MKEVQRMTSKTSRAATDVAASLTLAVITTSPFPLVMLDGDLRVVAASASFCAAFAIDCGEIAGRSFLELGQGEWDIPEFRALLTDTASGGSQIKAYAIDLKALGGPARRVLLNAHKLDYADADQVRLLLGAMEATDPRAAELLTDKLHREAVILLQEVRHRAANSLQIIGSVLQLTANRSKSEEVRAQLNDAYLRVMSVAALERQLAPSETGDVAMGAYLKVLCERIGSSLIVDRTTVTLELQVVERWVPADVSMSVGLIVTELVINAVKHAFPDGRRGQVIVGYQPCGAGWALTVRDDGAGRRVGATAAEGGLGATIVEALAKQHRAKVETVDARPGTLVTVSFD
jgi:two-component sensor histidine kinase